MKKVNVPLALFLFFVNLTLSFTAQADDDQKILSEEWIAEVRPKVLDLLQKNISPSGAVRGTVLASPSRISPDYYYHWVRDAALVMDTIVNEYLAADDYKTRKKYYWMLIDYAQFSRSNQLVWTPSGSPGEPKYNVNGTAYSGPWGRPQNDGPALRAITLIRFANILLDAGEDELVHKLLYDSNNQNVIKTDLEYVSHVWRNPCIDLWEEIWGHHFFTRIAVHRALEEGAALARRLKDPGAADFYHQQALEIEQALNNHWDDHAQYFRSSLELANGVNRKGLDAALVIGLLAGHSDDGFMDFDDPRVQSTVLAIEKEFQSIYIINNKGHRGIGIGRYPEDHYNGLDSLNQGNPWFLTTLTFAEYYYRLANTLSKKKKIIITDQNYTFYQRLGILDKSSLEEAIQKIRVHGDDFLAVVQFHMDENAHMSEQFHRETGYMQGAADLSWSYASFLTATRWRSL